MRLLGVVASDCACVPCRVCGCKHYCNLSVDHPGDVRRGECPAVPEHAPEREGHSCSCGWVSHTKAWRAHAAHMRRRGETTSEASR